MIVCQSLKSIVIYGRLMRLQQELRFILIYCPWIYPSSEPGNGKRASQEIAKKVGISHANYKRTKKIIIKGGEQ